MWFAAELGPAWFQHCRCLCTDACSRRPAVNLDISLDLSDHRSIFPFLYLMGKSMVSCRFSPKPMHWQNWIWKSYEWKAGKLRQWMYYAFPRHCDALSAVCMLNTRCFTDAPDFPQHRRSISPCFGNNEASELDAVPSSALAEVWSFVEVIPADGWYWLVESQCFPMTSPIFSNKSHEIPMFDGFFMFCHEFSRRFS